MKQSVFRSSLVRLLRVSKRILVLTQIWQAKRLIPHRFRRYFRQIMGALFPKPPKFGSLVYDVGMNNGDDTAYYLFRGYRVIAIEASPILAEKGRQRFEREIASGQLILLNIGIAAKAEISDFWISDQNADWSSFLPEQGCRFGTPCHSVKVQCLPFNQVLRRYGVPHFLKVDIEGYDYLCLEALEQLRPDRRPKFVSVEAQSLEWLFLLKRLGYDLFKIASQDLNWKISRHGWDFQGGSSGPLGDDLPGKWLDIDTIAYEWCHFNYRFNDRFTLLDPVTTWCDFHARRDVDV